MLTKQCNRCKKVIPYGMTYCKECAEIVADQRKQSKTKRTRQYDKGRDKQVRAFYNSSAWIGLSRAKMQDVEYMCEECGEMATEVHHVVPVKVDWDGRYDMGNLKALCVLCHNKAHGRF